MSWVAAGLTLGMGALGAYNASEQQDAQKKQNLAAAEHNRYSNWTGRQMNQRFDAPSVLGGAMQGGLSGLMMGQSMGGSGAQQPVNQTISKPTLYGGAGGSMTAANNSGPYGDVYGQIASGARTTRIGG